LLYTGGVVEGSNTIEIGDFALTLLLKTIGISNFQSSSYAAKPPAIQMNAEQITGSVPEPATLTILGFGSMLLRRKKIS
jgi:type 1 fimbria pilin